ncbi:hypothetical protein GCK32_022224 [Trichostrongylus colubriformis]|uniref:Uncharacterized protein n=1 Tax=Trichostrongylus colubriformis TaxID=6319 RepID=A0AAN8IEW8_TRICO
MRRRKAMEMNTKKKAKALPVPRNTIIPRNGMSIKASKLQNPPNARRIW